MGPIQPLGTLEPTSPALTVLPMQSGRRRFGRAGLAGGIILTLKSQSGMAAGVCVSPSGALSGGLSSHQPVTAPTCTGQPPAYWRTEGRLRVARLTFGQLFACNRSTAAYQNSSMQAVLSGGAFDPDQVGMYLAAAYMNALSLRTSFLKVPAVLAIWNQWQATGANAGGYYIPTSGARHWTSRDIVGYLAGTMQ